jgi:preprotein translocase subunit SecD
MPMIGENILENTSTDPAVTTPYAQQVIDDYNLQLKNPLSSDLTSLETGVVEAKMGSDFITKYFYSFISGLFLISAFFMIKFGAKSIVFSFSLFLSVLVYLAVSKILSIPIGTPLISSLVLITGIISAIGNYIFSRFKTGLKEGKPFEVLYLQILKKDKEIISYPSIFVLFLSFLIMLATSGIAKSFASAFLIGMLVVVLFYYFLLPTLMWAFRGKQK